MNVVDFKESYTNCKLGCDNFVYMQQNIFCSIVCAIEARGINELLINNDIIMSFSLHINKFNLFFTQQ